jgi:hypothetical protein
MTSAAALAAYSESDDMKRSTTILIAMLVIAAVAFLLWEQSQTPVLATDEGEVNPNSIVGASLALGDMTGPAAATANVSYYYPPPLSFMLPVTTSPGASNVSAPPADASGCNGC